MYYIAVHTTPMYATPILINKALVASYYLCITVSTTLTTKVIGYTVLAYSY